MYCFIFEIFRFSIKRLLITAWRIQSCKFVNEFSKLISAGNTLFFFSLITLIYFQYKYIYKGFFFIYNFKYLSTLYFNRKDLWCYDGVKKSGL